MAESGTYDLPTLLRRQQMAEQMAVDASKPRPIHHWAQGLAQLADTAASSYALNQANRNVADVRRSDQMALKDAIAGLMGGANPQVGPAGPQPSPQAPPMAPAGIPPPKPMAGSPTGLPVPGDVPPVTGPRPGGPVPSSSKVIGDDEAVRMGLYDPPAGASPARTQVASAMAGPPPTGAPPAAAAPTPPNTAPPTSSQVPPNNRAAILQLLSASPGSPAYQLGTQLVGQTLKPHDFGFQTLPDGTVLRTDPQKGTVSPIYQAPSKPSFGVVGKDPYGNDVHGFIDTFKQTTSPVSVAPQNAAPGTPGSPGSATGDEYFNTLPKPQAAQVKAIVEGRLSPPGSFALKTPYWQKMMADAAQYEPGFDMTKWTARNATAKDFASGKSAQNITSFNTALGHLDTLDKAATELGNTSFPMFNTVGNMLRSATGDPRVNKFNVAKTAVADELTRAFRGTGGNVHDLVQWEKAINSAASPEQLKAAIRQAGELLRSRIDSLGDTYNRGMNTKTEPLSLISPKARAVMERLSGEAQPETPTPPPGNVRKYNPATGKIE